MSKWVVTGGAGFIGSHMTELLIRKGGKVVVIDNFSTGRPDNLFHLKDSCEVIEADISQQGPWQEKIRGADYVIHLASLADIVPSIQDPVSYFNSNVVGTLNVLSSCSTSLRKFVYAGSSSCYGKESEVPTHEDAAISPEYPYALTKRLGEELVMHWNKVYDLKAVSTRFFNVYGTRSRTSGTYGAVFGVFLAQKLNGSPLTIVGDGRQTRDFTYVTDVCQGVYLAAVSEYHGEIFNLGSGSPVSINRVSSLIGGDVCYVPKRPGEPDCTHADISKAQRLLGYSPSVTIEEGVKRVLGDIDYWKSAPVWTPETIKEATKSWFEHLS